MNGTRRFWGRLEAEGGSAARLEGPEVAVRAGAGVGCAGHAHLLSRWLRVLESGRRWQNAFLSAGHSSVLFMAK